VQSEMHHEIRVRDDMPKIDYCVLTVAGNPTMSGGGGRKTQQPLASFFSPTTGPAPASHRPLRTPGNSAQMEAKTSVTAVATQFFAKLWGTNLSRPVGAPTADRKERERSVGILSTSFGEWYLGENPAASSNVAEGTEHTDELRGGVVELQLPSTRVAPGQPMVCGVMSYCLPSTWCISM
jgi:hypothetical protein